MVEKLHRAVERWWSETLPGKAVAKQGREKVHVCMRTWLQCGAWQRSPSDRVGRAGQAMFVSVVCGGSRKKNSFKPVADHPSGCSSHNSRVEALCPFPHFQLTKIPFCLLRNGLGQVLSRSLPLKSLESWALSSSTPKSPGLAASASGHRPLWPPLDQQVFSMQDFRSSAGRGGARL